MNRSSHASFWMRPLVLGLAFAISTSSPAQRISISSGHRADISSEYSAMAYGLQNHIFLNSIYLPTFRLSAEIQLYGDKRHFIVGRRSYFMVGEDYYFVENISRNNKKTKERGKVVFRRVIDVPKHAHIIHRTKAKEPSN